MYNDQNFNYRIQTFKSYVAKTKGQSPGEQLMNRAKDQGKKDWGGGGGWDIGKTPGPISATCIVWQYYQKWQGSLYPTQKSTSKWRLQ